MWNSRDFLLVMRPMTDLIRLTCVDVEVQGARLGMMGLVHEEVRRRSPRPWG